MAERMPIFQPHACSATRVPIVGKMTSSETLLPPPNVVFAAVAELAAADQPRSAEEGLDLLKSVGIYSGRLGPPATTVLPLLAVEPAGPWRATKSDLWFGPDNAVSSFGSSMWFDSAPEDIARRFPCAHRNHWRCHRCPRPRRTTEQRGLRHMVDPSSFRHRVLPFR